MRRTRLEQLRQPGRVCGPAVRKVTYCAPTSVNGYTISCSPAGFIKGFMRENERATFGFSPLPTFNEARSR